MVLAAEENLTVVTAWVDEVLHHSTEKEEKFPDAAAIAGFDSLQIDHTMDCPNPGQHHWLWHS